MTSKEQVDKLSSNLESIKETIGFDFYGKDNILVQAFTHSSFAKENTNFADNEHLEFFGDSFLNSYVSDKLFKQFCNFYDDNQLFCEKKNALPIGQGRKEYERENQRNIYQRPMARKRISAPIRQTFRKMWFSGLARLPGAVDLPSKR